LAEFDPDVVVCTQAFACGVLASWKAKTGQRRPRLVGVLTDFVAHRYWAHDQVDLYIAPNEATKQTLISQGVAAERVSVTGIPVNEKHLRPVDRETIAKEFGFKPGLPVLLVMGGSLGLGPMKSVIRKLDKLPQPFHIVAVTGKNEELKERLERRGQKLRHPTRILGFCENVHELMRVAELVVTKPGGITTAECLVQQLPMIIINPIPGQEAKNTEILLRAGVAVQAIKSGDVAKFVDEFFRNPGKLREMRLAAAAMGRPTAAQDAAREILNLLPGAVPARTELAATP
jgi:processive 1,2-diacylglycerol beta-glucosyltransferase